MKIFPTKIPDVYLIEPTIFSDNRGYFYENFSQKILSENNIVFSIVQENVSLSKKWVWRWFHFQFPHAQAKIIQVLSGEIISFALDIRKNSPTFWKYVSAHLSSENKNIFFLPKWIAHGFLSLEESTKILYKVDDIYDKNGEYWIFYDWIPDFSLEKILLENKLSEIIISEKDKNLPIFSDFYKNNPF